MLSTDYLPNIGGIAAHIYNLGLALQNAGHHIVVINPVGGDTPGIELSTADVPIVRVVVDARTKRFRNKMYRKSLFGRAALAGIDAAIQRFGAPQIIHQHDYQDTTAAGAAWAHSVPWVWTNHSARFLRDYERPLKKRYIKMRYSRVAGFIAASEERRDCTAALWPNLPIRYIANGVDTTRFNTDITVDRSKYGVAADDFVVLCPSRMVEKKGVLYLAQAISRILTEAPDIQWKFVFLASDGSPSTGPDYIEKIKHLLRAEEAKGQIVFLGNIDLHAMPEVNALANIVVMPSLMEAVSLSALEAMATGAALVASDVGGLPEIVRHEETGLLVPPRDASAIAAAVVRLGREPDLRVRLAKAGLQLAKEQYSWNIAAKKTEAFYSELMQR